MFWREIAFYLADDKPSLSLRRPLAGCGDVLVAEIGVQILLSPSHLNLYFLYRRCYGRRDFWDIGRFFIAVSNLLSIKQFECGETAVPLNHVKLPVILRCPSDHRIALNYSRCGNGLEDVLNADLVNEKTEYFGLVLPKGLGKSGVVGIKQELLDFGFFGHYGHGWQPFQTAQRL